MMRRYAVWVLSAVCTLSTVPAAAQTDKTAAYKADAVRGVER